VPLGQGDPASGYASFPETVREALRCLLSAAVVVGIKGYLDDSRAVTELAELAGVEMDAERARDIVKAGLPQNGIVEQSFDQDDFGK
jgi:hypothetical protein